LGVTVGSIVYRKNTHRLPDLSSKPWRVNLATPRVVVMLSAQWFAPIAELVLIAHHSAVDAVPQWVLLDDVITP
jgi:hypothetical protein